MSPLGIFLISGFIAYVILAALRSNFMRGRNGHKKQTDIMLLIVLTLFVWALVPVGK